jgi:hypothetical protein
MVVMEEQKFFFFDADDVGIFDDVKVVTKVDKVTTADGLEPPLVPTVSPYLGPVQSTLINTIRAASYL